MRCSRIFIFVMIIALTSAVRVSAQSILHDTRIVQFKTSSPSRKKVRPKSNKSMSRNAIPKNNTTKTIQGYCDNTVQIASVDTIEILPHKLMAEDGISKPFNRDFHDVNNKITNILNAGTLTERLLGIPNALGYSTNGEITTLGGFDFKGARERYEFPNMLTIQRLNMCINYNTNHLALTGGVNVNKYYAIGVTTQYGIHGAATYSFTSNLSMTAFGEFYSSNPWFYMAAFPYVKTSRYGGYITYKNDKFGAHLGVERYYDPFSRHWELRPIVTPFLKVSKKLIIELPVGDLLKNGASRLVHDKRRSSATIMPDM